MALRRISKELQDLQREPPANVSAGPVRFDECNRGSVLHIQCTGTAK